jgi:probable rRNA maturation factor
MTGGAADGPGVELVNLQDEYVLRRAALAAFVRDLRRRLRIESREFNICFMDNNEIRRLNLAYRGKDEPTDVLSFPWRETDGPLLPGQRSPSRLRHRDGITNFLGDVVISVETAGRNARDEGHSTLNEIRWLILHGVLHLLGYDHEHDSGEMIALELALREQLGVAGGSQGKKQVKSQNAKPKRQSRVRLNF